MMPLFLALHGALLLSDSGTDPLQWALVGLTAALGVAGVAGWRSTPAMQARAWLLLAITWLLLYLTGGVTAFFLLWMFMLAAVYPLVLRGKVAIAYPIAIGVAYLALVPVSDERLLLPVLLGRVTVLTAIGLVVAGISSSQRRAAESVLAAKDEFVASVSHELRTPLTAVVGFAAELHRLAEAADSPAIREYADAVHRHSTEVADIVEDLLVAARAVGGNVSVVAAPVHLRDEVAQVADEVTSIYGLPDGSLDIQGRPVVAFADPTRVRQILRNLVVNALRYGGPHIAARADGDSDRVWIEIADDGTGIPGAGDDLVFVPYQQFHPDGGRPDSIGLGLAVSRTLAHLMGGDLQYRRDDGWTIFRLELPTGERTGVGRD